MRIDFFISDAACMARVPLWRRARARVPARASALALHVGVRAAQALVLAGMAGCASLAPVPPDAQPVPHAAADAPSTAQPSPFANGAGWLGVALEDADNGLIITALHAGPATQAGLRAGDRLLAVDGVVLDAAGLQARVAARGAGQPLALRVARDGVTLPLTVTLGDRGAWSGPARHAAPARAAVQLPAAPPWQHAHAERLQAVMSTADRDATAALATMLEGVASARTGHNRSPWRDAVLADPAALASWPVAVRTMLAPALTTRDTSRRAFCTWLVLACAPAASSAAVSDIAMLGTRLARIVAQVDAAFVDWPGGRLALAADLAVLLEITAAGELVHDQPRAVQAIAAMQASMRVSRAGLLAAFADLTALRETIDTDTDTVAPLARVPAALARYVSGAVLAYAALDDGFVVIGGSGPNRYDMDGLYAVIDSGGDDHYHWSAGLPLPVQYIDDRAGDDHYSAARGGPGAGLLGVALLRDRGGDDRYASALAGCGAGVFGFGVLVDRAGRDVYACARWSSGAGLYGGGALLDGGAGADVYLSEVLAQGIGGPGGVGLLLDAGGNDYYRVNGAVASAYGTPGVFLGLGQGVGYGLRPHDHGGIGILRDLAGNDRYEAGEFGQGGGYFGGLGLLADEGGDDLYSGHRYAQGFAAHQAAGVLADAAGDDVYWALDRAAQGAAWDQSHALLHDGGGNDHYRAGALAQGAAAQQSRALLYDAAGDDVYRAGGAAQGAAGANGYWLRADRPVHSLGVLHDADGADRYDDGPVAGAVRFVRGHHGDVHDGRGVRGLAIDDAAGP